MKGTSILGWKIMRAIHPPLPLSARDSRHLLALLDISFTEALDKEYPKVSPEGRNNTDDHVHSVLSSPIFGPKPSADSGRPDDSPPVKKHTRTTATEPSKSAIHGPFESVSIANAMVEVKVKSFKKYISSGRANLFWATGCLRHSSKYLTSIDKKYRSQAFEGFGKHGMASIMLNWLWSSGLEKSDEVLLHAGFLPSLSPFLVAEGRLEEAMQWFRRLGAKAALYPGDAFLPMDRALAVCLGNAERSQERLLAYVHSLDGKFHLKEVNRAFESYKQVALRGGYLSEWPRTSLRQCQRAMLRIMVLYSLGRTSNLSLNTAISIFVQAINSCNVAGMSPIELMSVFRPTGSLIVKHIECGWKADQPDYIAFSSTVPLWNNTNDLVHYDLVRSIIKLHGANNPDWEPAYLFLSKLTSTIVKEFTLWERQRTVSLGLHTAKMLRSDGRSPYARRAKEIMESLQQFFRSELKSWKAYNNTFEVS